MKHIGLVALAIMLGATGAQAKLGLNGVSLNGESLNGGRLGIAAPVTVQAVTLADGTRLVVGPAR